MVDFTNPPKWHIVEIELSNHPLDTHIREQVNDFITATQQIISSNRHKIVNAIFDVINSNHNLRYKVEELTATTEIHKYLTDLILYSAPCLTIIIEKKTESTDEELRASLRYSPMNLVEFRTFIREDAKTVHAHLFEPLYTYSSQTESTQNSDESYPKIVFSRETGRETAKDLVEAGFLKVGQIIFRVYHGKRYEGKIFNDGIIELTSNGKKYPSLNAAIKGITQTSLDAWYFWNTIGEDGIECPLAELRDKYRIKNSVK